MRKQDVEKWMSYGIMGMRKEVQIKNKINGISELPKMQRIKRAKARNARKSAVLSRETQL